MAIKTAAWTIGLLILTPGLQITARGAIVLASGNQINDGVVPILTAMGHTVTYVSASSFSSASFAGFDAIYLDWNSNFNGLNARKTDLLAFVAAGGNLLAEITLVSGNPISHYPLGEELTLGGTHSNTVRIIDASHPLMDGLSSAGLSNWGSSHHGHYLSDIGSFSGIADTGTDDQWAIITKEVGAGNLIYISLDPSVHIKYGAGPTGPTSPKGVLIDNALTLPNNVAIASVPEPLAIAIWFALICSGGFITTRPKLRSCAIGSNNDETRSSHVAN
jgi:hypothetical protein